MMMMKMILLKNLLVTSTFNRNLITTICKLNNTKWEPKNEIALNPPKGTRDFHPLQMKLRERVFDTIVNCFKLHGALRIDTPVFERKDILLNKYGEDSKLIYEIPDSSEGDLALRYDLTVPFARYLANYQITNLKRYQLGKVYRKDQPNNLKGRYREFMQCDFDIACASDPMLAEVECIKLISEILNKLNFTNKYTIKVNHRYLINGLFSVCGLTEDKFKTASTAIDKLDKSNWLDIKEEMIKEREISEEIVDKIGNLIHLKGNQDVLEQLKHHQLINGNIQVIKAIDDLNLLYKYCKLLNISDKIEFNLSLMRGLDYYTGVIYEVTLNDSTNYGIGSVAAGGRYDNLVNMFNKKHKIQCVGLSIGVERLLKILESIELNNKDPIIDYPIDIDVFIATPQKGFVEERLKLCEELWAAGIKTEHSYRNNPKLLNQLQYCERYSIPICVLIGESEVKNGQVKIRNVKERTEETIERKNIIEEIKKRLRL